MKLRIILFILLSGFILSACSSMDKYKDEPTDVLHLADINGDDRPEIIRVKEKSGPEPKTIITVLKKNKLQMGSLSVPGKLEKIEFAELDLSPAKRISVIYTNKDGSQTLDIFSFKDDKFKKMFTIDSHCGIETDFSSILGRIKVGKFICNGDVCSCASVSDGEVWIWTGDKFLRER